MPTGIYIRTKKHRKIVSKAMKAAYSNDPSLVDRTKHLGKTNGRYIDGRSSKIYYCKCGREKDRRSKVCKKCDKHANTKGKHLSEYTKKIIEIKSKLKWTPNFKKQFRKTMEDRGMWIPEDKLTPYALYCKQAHFTKDVFKFLPKKQIKLLNTYKLFNAAKNKGGVVRDHRFSRFSGFKLCIPPILLRHPVNCEIIFHNANVSKAKKYHRYADGDSVSLKMLITEISNFLGDWNEQDKCLKVIKEFML